MMALVVVGVGLVLAVLTWRTSSALGRLADAIAALVGELRADREEAKRRMATYQARLDDAPSVRRPRVPRG